MRSRRQQVSHAGLKTIASTVEFSKEGRAPTWRSNDSRRGRVVPQPYTITRGSKEYYFTTGAQPSCLPSTADDFRFH